MSNPRARISTVGRWAALATVAATASLAHAAPVAADTEGVRHLVTRERANLSGSWVVGRAEQWLDRDRVLSRGFRDGRLLSEAYVDASGYYAFDPEANTVTRLTGLRLVDAADPALNGVPGMRRAGGTKIAGRAVVKYVDPPPPGSVRATLKRQVFVDRATARIVRDQLVDRTGRVRVSTDVLVDELLEDTPANRALVDRPSHPGAAQVEGGEGGDRP